ncbi:MAG: histidine kinase [Candidatus Nitrosotenuis sp.]
MEFRTAPDKLQNKINFKIIILIVSSSIFFQISLFLFDDENIKEQAVYVVSIINPLAASISSFVIANRYRSSKIFGKAYLVLACGYLCATIAEILYFVYEAVLMTDAYPSLADVFFFALYPFVLIHLIINIRFFKQRISLKDFLWMATISIAIISTYITLTVNIMQEMIFDFYYGIIFVLLPAIVLPFAILGAKVFKGGTIGTEWLVLVLAIMTLTIGDIWYYYLEIFDDYSLLHPVNIFWYAGYWIVVYALYKRQKGL